MDSPRYSILWRSFLTAIKRSIPYTLFLLWAALAWSVGLAAFYFTNTFGYYPLRRLVYGLPLLPVFYLPLAWFAGRLLVPRWVGQSFRLKVYWILLSLAAAGLIIWHYPLPHPVVVADHVLQIYTSGRKNADALGYVIEVQKLRYLDGQRVPLDALALTGEWDEFGDQSLVTGGTSPASLELRGSMPGGVAVILRYNEFGGIARVFWDGVEQEMDLYSLSSTSFYTVFEPVHSTRPARVFTSLLDLFYFSGLAFAVLLFILVYNLVFQRRRVKQVIQVLAYLGILGLFLSVKFSYFTFNDVRNLRDTYSYVAGTDAPWNSAEFWMGERTFTVPLFMKLVGVTTQNYTSTDVMWRMARFQTWFSILAWVILAWVVSRLLHHPWVAVLGFGVVLFFSANQEISMWDTFLLSESLSFALFALLVATWLVASARWFPSPAPARRTNTWQELPWLLGMLLVTVLYSFARDVNLYFIVVGSFMLFGLVGFLRIRSCHPFALAYLVCVLCLFVFQTSTVNSSGRWQIHVYDHLARRLLADSKAVAYLRGQGLPISEDLMRITRMTGPEYRLYLDTAPEMAAVREWMALHGRSAYLGFLVAYPLDALAAPLAHTQSLLNGSSLEYRYPKNTVLPVPPLVQDLTEKYYPHQWPTLLVLVILTFGSLGLAWRVQGTQPLIGWIILVIWITVYPLMFITYHGNPLEIERHAAQIGIQIRLAGWLALLNLMELVLLQDKWKKFWQVDPILLPGELRKAGG